MSGGACAVVGAQFGSEGKGAIVGHIAKDYGHHVRVGAANAGHTVYTEAELPDDRHSVMEDWPTHEKHVLQQLPCAAYANPEAELYIGPGALISPGILERELVAVHQWRDARGLPPLQLHVDPRAHIITERQVAAERRSGIAARIGSTSATAKEGIGAAQADRVMREPWCVKASDSVWAPNDGVRFTDVPSALWQTERRPTYRVEDRKILLEGTQGAGLSLTTGMFPYVTSRNTTVAGLCADAGLAPNRVDRVIVVARTYPIRVAGNSGPFHHGSKEIGWEDIGINPESERTTVTKKVRRVATFSLNQVLEACILNGATEIALTFADYLDPGLKGRVAHSGLIDSPGVTRLIQTIEQYCGVPVRYVGTGPHSIIDLHPKL